MSNPPLPIAPGWYPDPDDPGALHRWDGTAWTSDTQRVDPPARQVRLLRHSPTPGRLVQLLLAICALAALVGLIADTWGAMMLRSAASDPLTTDAPARHLWIQLNSATGAISLGLLLITGIVWLTWQYQLAIAMPWGTLRRSPAWHLGAWFVPVAAAWIPLQNMNDLHSGLSQSGPRRSLPTSHLAWWLAWVAGGIVAYTGNLMEQYARSLAAFARAATAFAIADLLSLGAAILAIVVVRNLEHLAIAAH